MADEFNRIIENLCDVVSIQSRNIDRLGERLENATNQLTAKIDTLAIEVGELRASIQDQKKSIDGLIEESREQHKVAQAQAQNIAKLIELATMQQQSVDRLLAKN